MKKILTITAGIAIAASVYGQGTVALQETAFKIQTPSGQMDATASGYYFTVLVSTATPASFTASDVANSTWLWTGIMGNNGTVGPSVGGIVSPGGANGATANNWAAGTTEDFIVVGWSAALGSTWASVSSQFESGNWANSSGLFGYSSIGSGASTSSPAPAFQLFGSNPGQVQGFTLNAVPEPATLALAGLSGLSLLAFRRKARKA